MKLEQSIIPGEDGDAYENELDKFTSRPREPGG